MTYDAVFISDVHLGTPRCNTEKFLKFLKELKTKKLVLVGDIIDIYCMEKYNTRWKREHTECVHQLLNLAKKGTEIVYILGNHDASLRRYCDFEHKNFKMCDEYVHNDSEGGKYLCTHGDKYSEYSSGSWKQLVFNKGYELITPLSIWLEKFFRFSLVYFLKNTVRGKGYIDRYERDLIVHCNQQKKNYTGVICGHIHHANIRQFSGLIYMCCGDFVDTCSAITEKNGSYALERYKG
jgi:UDP-2,3-diacylglucosamine pyrophosphatase LpxH